MRKDGRPIDDYRELVERLAQSPRSRGVGDRSTSGCSSRQHETDGAILKGVDLSAPARGKRGLPVHSRRRPRSLGEAETDPETGAKIDRMFIGRELARTVGLRSATCDRHLAPRAPHARGLAPRYRDFRVVGHIESGLGDYDATWAYISLEAAQRLAGREGVAELIQMKVTTWTASKR